MLNTYNGILKKYASFESMNSFNSIYLFQKSINPLYSKELRDTYELEKVAGNGNDISQILNTLFWLNNIVKHDGSYKKTKAFNSKGLLVFSIKKNIGLNCHMIAYVLNEIYLSLGFKSMYVFCNPHDKNDVDCHVINLVYVQSINKWIWIDGTYNIYLTDLEGNYLNIIDVRNMVLSDKNNFIKINKESNFDSRSVFIGSYLDYMCKNLVWFKRPLYTDNNNNELNYLKLLPINYGNSKHNDNCKITHDITYFFNDSI